MLQFSMPRKYRFTHFKNGERKKQAANKSMTCIAKPNDELHSLLNNTDLEHGWISVPDGSNLRLCKCIENVQATPHHTTFSHELTIRDNCTWSLLIHGFFTRTQCYLVYLVHWMTPVKFWIYCIPQMAQQSALATLTRNLWRWQNLDEKEGYYW